MMRAVCWCGKHDVRVETVADPVILNPRDAIVKVSLTSISGADLHLYNGYLPTVKKGDILGHEFMGQVVAVGREVRKLRIGERVVVPSTIACGQCIYCRREMWSLCDNTHPQPWLAEKLHGCAPAGMYGLSHMLGGYAGGQAEYVRVPFADVGPIGIPAGLTDEQALLLSDAFPRGYQAVEQCNLRPGETVAVWGAGAVGQLAIRSAFLLGAGRVIAIDEVPDRLDLAAASGADPVNFRDVDVPDVVRDMTAGRGPDACIDCVGLEAHGTTADAIYDRVKAATHLATDRPHALREAIHCCRKGGIVSIVGFYTGMLDRFPLGQAYAKGLTLKMGQPQIQRNLRPLLERIVKGDIDPSFVITHRKRLENAPELYAMFAARADRCIKAVMQL